MRLATFQEAGQVRLGALCGRWMVDLGRTRQYLSPGRLSQDFPSDMVGLLCSDKELLAELDGMLNEIAAQLTEDESDLRAARIVLAPDAVQYLPPVQAPGKILCVGLNYPIPGLPADRPAYPVIFGKFANTLVGHRQSIILPKVSRQVACEGELALVVGRSGRHIPPEIALDYLAGCTLANDLTASDLESRSSQWMTGKLPDTFTPLGPVLVTMDEIPVLNELVLRTYRNGELVLNGYTGEMFYGARELISYLSGITTLEVGDLILTGSPKGVDNQPAPKVLVNPGDEIVVEIETLGRLANQAVAEASDDR